jgi:hypothetical protein
LHRSQTFPELTDGSFCLRPSLICGILRNISRSTSSCCSPLLREVSLLLHNQPTIIPKPSRETPRRARRVRSDTPIIGWRIGPPLSLADGLRQKRSFTYSQYLGVLLPQSPTGEKVTVQATIALPCRLIPRPPSTVEPRLPFLTSSSVHDLSRPSIAGFFLHFGCAFFSSCGRVLYLPQPHTIFHVISRAA